MNDTLNNNGEASTKDTSPQFRPGDLCRGKGTGCIYTIMGIDDSREVPCYFLEGLQSSVPASRLERASRSRDAYLPITDRILTFTDACAWCRFNGYDSLLKRYDYASDPAICDDPELLAYSRLRIITIALNEGWEPSYLSGETRYFPYFVHGSDEFTIEEEFGNMVAFPQALCFKNENAASAAASRFSQLYAAFNRITDETKEP